MVFRSDCGRAPTWLMTSAAQSRAESGAALGIRSVRQAVEEAGREEVAGPGGVDHR